MVKKALSVMLLAGGVIVGSQISDVPKVSAASEVFEFYDIKAQKNIQYVFETTKPSIGEIPARYNFFGREDVLYVYAVEPNINGKYTTSVESKLGLTKEEVAEAIVVLTKMHYEEDYDGHKAGDSVNNSVTVFVKHNGILYYYPLPYNGFIEAVDKKEKMKSIYQAAQKYLELERAKQ